MIEQASLVIGEGNWAVKSDSLLGYKINGGKYYPREMSVVRATTGTRINEDGLVELVPYNLLQRSEEFDNAAWSKTAISVSANSATAPNGLNTADTLSNTSASAIILQTSPSVNTSTVVTHSVYLKRTNNDWVVVAIARNGATTYGELYVWFNIATGAVGSNLPDGAAVLVDADIEDAGNGWYRCSVTGYVPNAVSYVAFMFFPDANSSFNRVTSQSVYAWGAQLVEGSSALDYLPTTDRLDVARIDYSSGSGALLVEPQRTNLALYSSSFDLWSQGAVSITVNNNISPSGTQDADLITANGANTQHYIQKGVSQSAKTYSVFAKMGTQRYIQILTSGTAAPVANFDLQDGVANMVGSNSTASIEDFGNGWWRCILQTNDSLAGDFYINYADSLTMGRFGATISSGTLYLWGAQAEIGSYATSLIPTQAATVTRNADAISKTGIADLIGQTEGTLFAEVDWNVKPESGSPVIGILTLNNNVSDLQNCIILGAERNANGINKIYCLVINSNVVQAELFGSSITDGTYKIALAYKANDFALYVNGSQIATDTSGSVPTTSQVLIGTRRNSDNFTLANRVAQALLFTTRLTNAQLATLTTI